MVAHDDHRLAKVGFAKLVGIGIELYTKKHEITMGRLSKSGHVDVVLGRCRCICLAIVSLLQASHMMARQGSSSSDETSSCTEVTLPFAGENMNISRQHASIVYSKETGEGSVLDSPSPWAGSPFGH